MLQELRESLLKRSVTKMDKLSCQQRLRKGIQGAGRVGFRVPCRP